MTAIDIRELTMVYGSVRAVDRLTFSVLPGRVTGFLGPNGAGKSTTMRAVLGLDRPASGTATVGGRPYRELDRPLRHVGALLDASAAHGSRTARDHLRCLALSNDLPARRVEEALAETGLANVAGRRVKTFSLGMRQRLGIAAALLGEPPVLMFDEPANGLDPEGIVWIRTLMRRLAAEGRTVLVSSHLMTETALTADHLVVLGRGRLLADTAMDDFVREHSHPRARVRTSEPERLRAALADEGLAAAVADDSGAWAVDGVPAAELGALAARHGVPVLELVDDRTSLEQAYLRLTAEDTEFAAQADDTDCAAPAAQAAPITRIAPTVPTQEI
ncbi:ATP-binding cassette domain-containing protein [Streptomyces sp. XD-27]|uniref:ATP-binding cassette domain-containing protein n=1 Tax=Streptomyces sp. XD-27 TaxID=3062779 RepID=UPI0026F4690D|nr:ATP-binding cassette domain-containing protein [Streptomyces sp. XD-27]WKX73901.1 ATP-binding cassette domain-containing protein [Streptomyces sp. XD-27]